MNPHRSSLLGGPVRRARGRLRGRPRSGRLPVRHRGRPAGRPRQAAGRSPGAGRSVAGLPGGHEPGGADGGGLRRPARGPGRWPVRRCRPPSQRRRVEPDACSARAAVDLDFGPGPPPHIQLRELLDDREPLVDAAVGRDARSGWRRAGPVPAPGRDRPGRHGGDPQGSRRRPGQRAGDQGAARVAPGQSRGRAPVRRGGADRRPVAASRGRAGLRAGDFPRPAALFRHEAGQGADSGRLAPRTDQPGAGPAAVPVDLRAGLPDDGLCPRAGRDPPRPEAVERDGGILRRGPGDGLGTGQGAAAGGHRRRGGGPGGPGNGRSRRCEAARPGAAASRRQAASWARPRTWPPSRPGARSSGSTSAPTCSAWGRSSARS